MNNKFTDDKDLMFLYNISNDNIKLLVDILVYDKDGDERFTEDLTTNPEFKKAYPNNLKTVLPLIIDELQCFGGNTFFNIFRGHGVKYKEILVKVCKQYKVSFNENASAELLERYLLQKILMIAVDKMSDEDVKHLGDVHTKTKDMLLKNINSFHMGDPIIIKLVTTLVIEVAKKNGLKALVGFAGKFAGGRFFAILTGPIGWAVAAAWTIFDFAGPAYRVMIPATIAVAYLRIISQKTEEELDKIFN
jgi:uncharacterized protein YaaW (UPF0174 family)